jgi:hypothetical protein
MNTKYHKKRLTINNNSIDLPFDIENLIELKDMIVIILDDNETLPSDSRLLDRNIYAFNKQAHEIWRIQQCPHGGEQPKPYMLIKKNENGELIASNYIGVDYIVNLNNGSVEPYGSGIRPW